MIFIDTIYRSMSYELSSSSPQHWHTDTQYRRAARRSRLRSAVTDWQRFTTTGHNWPLRAQKLHTINETAVSRRSTSTDLALLAYRSQHYSEQHVSNINDHQNKIKGQKWTNPQQAFLSDRTLKLQIQDEWSTDIDYILLSIVSSVYDEIKAQTTLNGCCSLDAAMCHSVILSMPHAHWTVWRVIITDGQ